MCPEYMKNKTHNKEKIRDKPRESKQPVFKVLDVSVTVCHNRLLKTVPLCLPDGCNDLSPECINMSRYDKERFKFKKTFDDKMGHNP